MPSKVKGDKVFEKLERLLRVEGHEVNLTITLDLVTGYVLEYMVVKFVPKQKVFCGFQNGRDLRFLIEIVERLFEEKGLI